MSNPLTSTLPLISDSLDLQALLWNGSRYYLTRLTACYQTEWNHFDEHEHVFFIHRVPIF